MAGSRAAASSVGRFVEMNASMFGEGNIRQRQGLDVRPYLIIKRAVDISFSLLLLIPASVVIALCAIAIKTETQGPAFFVQERPGYKGKVFRILKLRTMIIETEHDGKKLSDIERMTAAGRVIRACSFDELPQLINILKGEMSFIGPRPLLVQYLPLYGKEQMRRHDVMPGISGWAQVNGRNELTWAQKFERDVWYVDHVSFGLDVKIVWMTIKNVLKRQGINAGIDHTMQVFTGAGSAAIMTSGAYSSSETAVKNEAHQSGVRNG